MAIILSKEAREEIVARLVEKGNPFYNTRDGEYYTDGKLVWWRDAQWRDHPPGDRVSAPEEAVPITAFIPPRIELSWPNEEVATAEKQAALLRAEIYDEIGDS
ncbi:MAG: hypothetical protein H8E35_06945 [Ardenticatenia bacterium]|nr:hypothetical protein [Ardenticatenia bacterium]